MHKIILIIGLLLSTISGWCNDNVDTIKVTMSCNAGDQYAPVCSPFCAFGIEKVLKNNLEDPQNIGFDMETGTLSFQVSAGTGITKQFIKDIFKDSGFEVLDIHIQTSNQ